MYTPSYLKSLIAEGEHQQQDFKFKVKDAVKLAHSVSAFANTEGGRLLVGVRDDGEIIGVRSEEETFMLQQAASVHCTPTAEICFDTFEHEGQQVVMATIPQALRKPVYAIDKTGRRVAYVRIADENIMASPIHLEIWKQERASTVVMTYNDAERQLIQTLRNHPGMTLNRLVRLSALSRYRVIKSLARLIRYHLAEMNYEHESFTFCLASDGQTD